MVESVNACEKETMVVTGGKIGQRPVSIRLYLAEPGVKVVVGSSGGRGDVSVE